MPFTSLFVIPREVFVKVLYVDPDYVLLDIQIGDGEFAGSAQLYESPDIAGSLAAQLVGFPRSSSDVRVVELGSFEERAAGGGVHLRFDCTDKSAHAQVTARLLDKNRYGVKSRSVECVLPVEAAAVDDFVSAIRSWAPAKGDSARCVGLA